MTFKVAQHATKKFGLYFLRINYSEYLMDSINYILKNFEVSERTDERRKGNCYKGRTIISIIHMKSEQIVT